MNTNSINIYVAGKAVADILGTVDPPAGLSCNVRVLEAGTVPCSDAQDVIILKSLPTRPMNARLILCCKNHTAIPPGTLASLYDLWPEPLTPSLLRFHYAKLLDRLRLEQLTTSEELLHQKRIAEMARQDYLTGLATRWCLQEHLTAHQDEENVTCVYFDLDNFKSVNDTYGHQAGDRALAATSEMMQRDFSPGGFCARMGGDEFMIVLLGQREVSQVADKVTSFMAGLLEYYAGTRTMKGLSVSAGIAQKTSGEDKSIDRLIHEADMALYEAKKSGRACCKVYTPELEHDRDRASCDDRRSWYLVDYENVHAGGLEGIHRLGPDSTVCIFYSRNASQLTGGLNMGIRESKAEITYIHAEAGTKNALDFQLSSYLGGLIAENTGCECRYFIVSKDGGFAGLIPFWKERGVTVEIISDITGHSVFTDDELAQKVSVLTGETQFAPMIADIIRNCGTKTAVNNALQKLYSGIGNASRSGQAYRAVKPLIADKPGGIQHSKQEA